MLKEKRIMQIMNMLKKNGEVEIGVLCRMFNVTEMTIRRDLDNLTKDGKVIRTHGGAMLANQDMLIEAPFDRRIVANNTQKEKIAKKALEFVTSGKTIFIDSGTTGYIMARNVPNSLHIIALTNAINIASELISREHISVVMIGGELMKNTLSCRGTIAEETLEKFRVDIAFLGTNAISENGEMYIGSVTETGFKKKVINAAAKKYVLVDSSKINNVSLCKFADVTDVDCIITDDGITKEQYDNLTKRGANIIVVE